MEIKLKRSVLSIYLTGFFWLLYGCFFPLYRISDFMIIAGISILVYFVSSRLLPAKKIMIETPLLDQTDDDRINAEISEINKLIDQIRSAKALLTNKTLLNEIDQIENLVEKIFEFVSENKDQLSSVRRFADYYLPTTLKLIKAYAEFEEQGIQGQNISDTMKKIEEMLFTIRQAFEKQLDSLFSNDALDISTDIQVMESIITQEGLIKNNELKQ